MTGQEATRLSERVIAGMRFKGTKSGKPLRRPGVAAETERAIRRFLRSGVGISKVARTLSSALTPCSGSRRSWAALSAADAAAA
jgi:hypothetical protein